MAQHATVTRDDVEAALWRCLNGQGTQQVVDDMLWCIDLYASTVEPEPPPIELYAVDAKRIRIREFVPPDTHRTCTRCGVWKGIGAFNKDKNSRQGRKAQCKLCESDLRKERELRNKQQDAKRQET